MCGASRIEPLLVLAAKMKSGMKWDDNYPFDSTGSSRICVFVRVELLRFVSSKGGDEIRLLLEGPWEGGTRPLINKMDLHIPDTFPTDVNHGFC